MKIQSIACPFCGASAHQSISEALRAMENCKNCRIDLALEGQWTGYSREILAGLVVRYGVESVKEAILKLKR